MASDFRKKTRAPPTRRRSARSFASSCIDKTTEKINAKLDKQADKVAAKTAKHVDSLDRLAAHLETIDVWTRTDRGSRKPRFNRDDIAAAAIRIADAEGFEAVSMRRLAAELDAGTMTLYHYVRTKDELLTLVVDALMGEVVIPVGQRLPRDWRAAITLIAKRSRDALRRHPWILDITDDPSIGPNAMRHFDQSWQALAPLDASSGGQARSHHPRRRVRVRVLPARAQQPERRPRRRRDGRLHRRTVSIDDEYPALAGWSPEMGMPRAVVADPRPFAEPGRFDRNLARLLAGFEASLPRG